MNTDNYRRISVLLYEKGDGTILMHSSEKEPNSVAEERKASGISKLVSGIRAVVNDYNEQIGV